jgi:CDP-diacylglycerol--glycerol-3-phosphate 3-phosphatidyltransferase
MVLVFLDHEKLFVFFIWFNLTTDILDGWLARRLNQVTEAGTMLDGLADTGTYILAITGMFRFKWEQIEPYAWWFYIFIALLIAARLFSYYRFGRLYGYQTYGGKAAAYIHGLFFLVLFIFGFYRWFYFIMIFSGYFVFLETIVITAVLRESRSNVKGLWWLLSERRQGK